MFKNIFKIYTQDMENIFTNYAAIIVFLALCILPSLYAWFNIKASWDPYSQEATSQILIGVVNEDTGSELNHNYLNLGDQVVAELKNNQLLGWQFVDKVEADHALEVGTYYATITIPKNFTTNILSLLTSDVRKGEIVYTVNEKINAIAPKLTAKGATGVQESVNKAVVETVSAVLLESGKQLGVEIQGTLLPKLSDVELQLNEVISKFKDMNETVEKAADGAIKIEDLIRSIQNDIPLIQDTLAKSQQLTQSVESFISTSQNSIKDLAPSIKEDIRLISEISNEVELYVSSIKSAVEAGSDKAPEMIENLLLKINSGDRLVQSLISILEGFNKITAGKPLTPVIDQLKNVSTEFNRVTSLLEAIQNNLGNGDGVDLSLFDHILNVTQSINQIANGLYERFDTDIINRINQILDEAYQTSNQVLTVLKEAETKLPTVEDILTGAYAGVEKGVSGIEFIKEKLPLAEQMVIDLFDKMKLINESEELQEVLDLLQEAVDERTKFLTSPVELVEETLYPMGNYGSAMTPFYSVLSLWVGATFLISMLAVHTHGDYRPVEVYFGKLLLFLTIGIIQALIVGLGDVYLLDIYCVNKGLLVGGFMFTSVVFVFIGYSLVSVFGNVGKVISIILLVLQVAGSGGTFPIQLTPHFFQVINPFLPFTYSISLAREAIGGVVPEVFGKDITILLSYVLVAIVVSLFFKKPINKLLDKFTIKYKESGIGEV